MQTGVELLSREFDTSGRLYYGLIKPTCDVIDCGINKIANSPIHYHETSKYQYSVAFLLSR